MNKRTFREYAKRTAARAAFVVCVSVLMLASVCLARGTGLISAGAYAASSTDKLELVGTPTVYVQSGGENIVSLQVKNVSGAQIKGVNLYHGWSSIEAEENGFVSGSSEYSSVNPAYNEAEDFYRFASYFEKDGYAAVNATWNTNEEGYTIAAGKTATLWFKVRSDYENPGTYNEWIRLGDTHTGLAYGFIPVTIADEAYSGELPIKVVVYNPANAALTVGTSTNSGVEINKVALGSAIDFGTVDLTKSTGLTAEKTIYTRNTSNYNNYS